MKEREFRMNYIQKVWWRYKAASKALKGKMLDEFCKVCGYKNRKYAIRKFGNCPPEVKLKVLIPRSRKKTYGPGVLRIVESVWEEANYPWSVRLKEIIRVWLPWVKKHYQVKEEVEKKLLGISARTIDRHLRCKKIKMKRRIYGHTKPGSLLRHHIPIKTEYWDVKSPGFIEVDLVSHSGDCSEGEYIYSLNLTDIYSGWVETHAVMGKGEEGVFKALLKIRLCLPFKLLGRERTMEGSSSIIISGDIVFMRELSSLEVDPVRKMIMPTLNRRIGHMYESFWGGIDMILCKLYLQ